MADSPFKNFFQHQASSCYNNEKLLYSKLVGEALLQNGVKTDYYITDYNTSRDQIYGEDTDRTILRKFPVILYYMLPKQDQLFSKFGIEDLDNFKMWVAKDTFAMSSTLQADDATYNFTRGSFPQYVPKVGDLVRSKASSNQVIYEILNVKDSPQDNQFLQSKNVWEFQVRVYRDLHLNLSPTTSATMTSISAFTDQDDYIDINDVIDTEKTDIIITSADDIVNGDDIPNDPFGGW